jgi:hypothetical protein
MDAVAGLRALTAELESTPQRWWRAARVGFITAAGAGVMSAMQIVNPLGLTLLVNFALPEASFPLARGLLFLGCSAILQTLGLFVAAALVESPAAHLTAFIILSLVTTYVIYAVPTLGRLWIWIQVPVVTAFYMVMFEPRTLGWDNGQMFSGLAIAVGVLWLFNNVLWPCAPELVLADSLAHTLERSRRRMLLLIDILLGRSSPDDDRPVASRLGYHLSLLAPAAHGSDSPNRAGTLLAYVMIAERIHNEVERLAASAAQYGDVFPAAHGAELGALAIRLAEHLSAHAQALPQRMAECANADAPPLTIADPELKAQLLRLRSAGLDAAADPMLRICELLEINPLELPVDDAISHARREPAVPNHFLVRFSVRHTVALTASFLIGLWDNNAALHAAIWLLMLGGPPSHGATARKFTMRAIGASGALLVAALGTIIVAPSFTSPGPYMAVIFVGTLLMAYIGEGGGILSYMAIGGTAFVIAYGGPGPRPDVIGSIWSIWGISLGMIVRAVVSILWRENSRRTLAEQFQGPLKAMLELLGDQESFPGKEQRASALSATVRAIASMLTIANDAQLEGRGAGIDGRNLVDALDTMRRLAFSLGNLSRIVQSGDAVAGLSRIETIRAALKLRLTGWLDHLRTATAGVVSDAPLREMVLQPSMLEPALDALSTGAKAGEADRDASRSRPDPDAVNEACNHVLMLLRILERQLTTISVYQQQSSPAA